MEENIITKQNQSKKTDADDNLIDFIQVLQKIDGVKQDPDQNSYSISDNNGSRILL